MLYDPVTVLSLKTKDTAKVFAVPATEIAREEFKSGLVANSVMFGAFIRITGLLDEESARRSLETQLPSEALEINLRAFR